MHEGRLPQPCHREACPSQQSSIGQGLHRDALGTIMDDVDFGRIARA